MTPKAIVNAMEVRHGITGPPGQLRDAIERQLLASGMGAASAAEQVDMLRKKVIAEIKLQIPAGQANPSPPVGPALGHSLRDRPEDRYLLAGKSPRRILDTMQLADAQVILETKGVNNFSLPQHCFEYMNSLAWFFDNFDHPHQVKLLYVAASLVNTAAHNQASGSVSAAQS